MGSGKLLKRAIEKYGIQNFTKDILYEAKTSEEMFLKEKEFVKLGKQSYNIKEGGQGGFDYINKKGLNNKLNQCRLGGLASNGFTGKKHKEESKNKIGLAKLGNEYWLGRKHKDNTKIKMSLSAIGKHDGIKNSQYGTMWITNGIENKKIKKEEIVPNGWNKGRII